MAKNSRQKRNINRRETSGGDDGQERSSSGKKQKLSNVRTGGDKSGNTVERKVFNDSVHGHFELHPLLVKIIDTPEFQRLRFIRQQGMCYFVYSGSSHNRFEHSLGVSYLAGKFARSLKRNQEKLNIDDKDILCVEVAGLCHDLGHGPFSHLFDDLFLPKVLGTENPVKHEQLSVKMFEHMLEKNNLKKEFKRWELLESHLTFIKELIVGVRKNEEGSHEKKRGEDKNFLLDIVANKRNGIDVDKWDYFARDTMYLGLSNSFDWKRYVKFARVVDGEICTRDKEITNLYGMFRTRYELHQKACQHKATNILGYMIVDALIAANDHLKFPLEDGREIKMSECIENMEAYSKLTDHVMWMIFTSRQEGLKKAKHLIERIMKRELYYLVGETNLDDKEDEDQNHSDDSEVPSKCDDEQEDDPTSDGKEEEVKQIEIDPEKAVEEIYNELGTEEKKEISADDIVTHIIPFSYGMGEKDPMGNVRVYLKSSPEKTENIQDLIGKNSMMLPKKFSERFLRVYFKQRNYANAEWVKKAFDRWCKGKNLKSRPGVLSPPKTPETEDPTDFEETREEASKVK